MNIKRFFNSTYLSWEDYQKLVYTMQFIDELNQAMASSEIKKIGGEFDGL